MQNIDLRNKSYKQFLVKNKSGATRKKKKFDFFFQLNFFSIFFFNFLIIIYLNQIQKKLVKFELGHQKKNLDECSSTLEFFL